jgi:A/G-specific adenine glycosylase
LHKTAQFVAFERNGIFPNTYIELIKLKGIGEYTAAAIASFAYDEAVPVVDGNVFRVLSRYFDIPTDISLASAKKEFSATAFEVMDKNQPALFNQAIMEFGAIQCVPKNPNCDVCVFNNSCLALQKKNVSERPVKLKKIKIQERHINYLIIIDQNGRIPIQKRTEKGIWQNLYEFPNIETIEFTPDSEIIECIRQNMHFSTEIESVFRLNLNKITHKLSHQHLHINFWEVHVLKDIEGTYERQELIKFPFPIVIYNFIENNYKF